MVEVEVDRVVEDTVESEATVGDRVVEVGMQVAQEYRPLVVDLLVAIEVVHHLVVADTREVDRAQMVAHRVVALSEAIGVARLLVVVDIVADALDDLDTLDTLVVAQDDLADRADIVEHLEVVHEEVTRKIDQQMVATATIVIVMVGHLDEERHRHEKYKKRHYASFFSCSPDPIYVSSSVVNLSSENSRARSTQAFCIPRAFAGVISLIAAMSVYIVRSHDMRLPVVPSMILSFTAQASIPIIGIPHAILSMLTILKFSSLATVILATAFPMILAIFISLDSLRKNILSLPRAIFMSISVSLSLGS